MSFKTVLLLLCIAITVLVLSNSVFAFGKPNSWSSGWGQGVSEYVAVNNNGDKLYIACSPESAVSMSLEVNDRSYGSSGANDFNLIIDGEEIQTPYETGSRVHANNFYYAWDALRKAHSIIAVTEDGYRVELPSQGSASALPKWGTPEFACRTEF